MENMWRKRRSVCEGALQPVLAPSVPRLAGPAGAELARSLLHIRWREHLRVECTHESLGERTRPSSRQVGPGYDLGAFDCGEPWYNEWLSDTRPTRCRQVSAPCTCSSR
jgi:hypothetical protein